MMALCEEVRMNRFINNNNNNNNFYAIAALTLAGTWNQMAVELVQEIGRRITLVFLFQRLSIALQRGNAISFLSTFTATD